MNARPPRPAPATPRCAHTGTWVFGGWCSQCQSRTPGYESEQRDVPAIRWAFAALCAYESGAILTGRYPTLSALIRRHHWAEALLLLALAAHLYGDRLAALRKETLA